MEFPNPFFDEDIVFFLRFSSFGLFVSASVGGAAAQRWGASAGCQLRGAGGALWAAPRGVSAAAAIERQGDNRSQLSMNILTKG